MSVVSMKALLETGVHFGHRTPRWNPKMKPYIFTERNGIHIVDLQQTLVMINSVFNLVRDKVSEGGEVLFVGTKRQAQDTISREAGRAAQPYVNQRWLGGTLTNWQTIRQRIDHLDQLEQRREAGEFELLKKKERLHLTREIDKLSNRLGGIRKMKGVPALLFVVDINHEETAVKEANILNIPVIAMVDTNCNPDPIDFIIPSNDDAIRAIKLITSKIADAALEGMAIHKEALVDRIDDFDTYGYEFEDLDDAEDERLLGEATLAKLREGGFGSAIKEGTEEVAQAAEPVAAEPVAAEPAAVEPVAVEPVAVEPIEAEPVAVEPIEAEPIETEPIEAEPFEAEPFEAEDKAAEVEGSELDEVAPVEAEPTDAEPAESEAVVGTDEENE
ncbi:MAG: 30S ribosomal protein S2 [Candidatus Promineifilaceae bacterium]